MSAPELRRRTRVRDAEARIQAHVEADASGRAIRWCGALAVLALCLAVAWHELGRHGWEGAAGLVLLGACAFNAIRPHGMSERARLAELDRDR